MRDFAWRNGFPQFPSLNKDTAFSDAERAECGLHGLLVPQFESLEGQFCAPMKLTGGKTATWNATSMCVLRDRRSPLLGLRFSSVI